MSKMDRQGVRTASDLERKYDFGGMKKGFAEVVGMYSDAREVVEKATTEIRTEFDTKLGEYAGKNELSNYATKSELSNYAEKSDLSSYAKTSALDAYAKTSDLTGYAKASELTNYAKQSDLNSYAKASELDSYAKSSDLSSYATKTDLDNYVTDTEHSEFKNATNEELGRLDQSLEFTSQIVSEIEPTVWGTQIDVYDHFTFEEGGTRINGSVVPLLLPEGTDLDGVILPNKYVSGNVAEYGYANCPISTGTFSLEVSSCGNEGQLLQRLSYSHKTDGKTYERVFYQSGWGEWVCVSDYTESALNAIRDDVETLGTALNQETAALETAFNKEVNTLEAALNTHKTDSNTRMSNAESDIGKMSEDLDALGGRTQELELAADNLDVVLQGVILDINDHFEFVEGGTSIKGGLIPMVLPAGTDLDGVTIPKKYASGSVENSNYANCPITSGTFSLEVEYCGSEGQLLQRLSYGHKTNGKTYERVLDQDGWGGWVVVADYSSSALKAIQNEIDALEATVSKNKTDANARIAEAEGDVAALSSSTQSLNASVQMMSADLQGVINDVNNHFEFNEGGLRIKGAINPMLIPAGTDLDSLIIPNKYIGGTVTEYNYANCPVPSGTFALDVELCGNQGQLKQTLSYCNKTISKTYERYYYGTSWGEWFCITDFAPAETSKLLWNEGVYYMTATQTVNLPEAISAQKNGIILVFSEYSGGALDSAFHCFFVPKTQVATQPGKSYVFSLATSKFEYMATKQVLIYDTKIEGHADNNASGTGASGIKYTNNRFALRYVFGV